jgi:L-alanine-DL-glutamate epimerase-like enolase superfamily enzyme
MRRNDFIKTSASAVFGLFASNNLSYLSAKDSAYNSNSGVKITKVKPYQFKKATFVKIESSEGVSGWGEVDGGSRKISPALIEKELSGHLIGQDPFNSEYLWHKMYFTKEDMGRNGILTGSIAGLDNALWDLKGKLLGMPVHKLLGGANREKIQVYGSFGREKDGRFQSPEEMAKIAVGFVEQGYKALNPSMQIRQLGLNPDPDPTFGVVEAVRKAVGDEIKLFVDFNNGYTAAKAIMVAKKLHEYLNVELIEEPVTYQSYKELRRVVEALDIPVSAGEHEYNKWDMRDLILEGDITYVNADVIKCGGITECKKVAGIAHAFDKLIMTHNARPTLATAANLQFLGSVVNAARFQEYGGKRENLNLSNLFQNYFEFYDGYLMVPQTPGLGLIPDEKEMEKQKIN